MLGARACGIPEGEGPGAEREKRRRMTRGQGGEEERWLIQCGGRRGRSELDLRLEICREGLGEAWLKALEKKLANGEALWPRWWSTDSLR